MGSRTVGIALLLLAAPAFAAEDEDPNHISAAAGGGVAGLVCGGVTLTYARIRESAGSSGPLLWHEGESAGWVGVFFLEHAVAGSLTGALGRGTREGMIIGGAITCTLDLVWIVSAELLARSARDDDEGLDDGQREPPPLGLAELGPRGLRVGLPPVIVTRRGAWMSLFAWRF